MKKTILILIIISLCLIAGCYYKPEFAQAIAIIETVLMSSFIGMVIIPIFYDHKIKDE